MKNASAIISVTWGNDVEVSIKLTPRNWAKVQCGKPLKIRGKGYYYEGEFFWDYWSFEGGFEGSLLVSYGQDGGVGFEGKLRDASIQEQSAAIAKKHRL
jgi:hypothetical protein